ncbi:Vmc-like lipoprotein signal peptide domain-containing protein [Spiroplasma endosymbiont of Megaselia nigra]|uniref:Vmc-like lipoprotein signal peptide domain-containing protein n=1 Tax=Spiroplasma endosymbiont of Megaselia nigra TaxID=2478537 RepID=UPI000FA43D43|nr:hypothetical protein D9R21_04610 [Spiroplasma endosymbiont of Megaselia nigra]
MKRLFSILGAIVIFSISASSLTACKKPENTQNTTKDQKKIKQIQITKIQKMTKIKSFTKEKCYNPLK